MALALAGYLAALAATPTGQGLRLLSHLASDHAAAPPSAPTLVHGVRADGYTVLPTLRADLHRHGHEGLHVHGDRRADGGTAYAVHVHATPPATTWAGGADFHEHDGALHSHGAPAPEPTVVPIVSLDKHRLPEAPPVPAPPPSTAAPPGASRVGPALVSLAVETPPPIGRGDRAS